MQSNKKNTSPTSKERLVNNRIFGQQRSANRTAQLRKRFADKSFCEQTAWLKSAAYSFSVIINIISIIGALYGAVWAFQFLGAPTPIAALIGVSILVLIEIAKRYSSDEVWDTYWKARKWQFGWVGFSLFLFLLSATISCFGVYQGMQDFAPVAEQVEGDSTLALLNQQLSLTNANTTTLSETKNKEGVIFWPAQKALASLAKTQTEVVRSLNERQGALDRKNEVLAQEHQASVLMAANIALAFYLMLELLFEACMSFCSHYDFRDYLERIGSTPNEYQYRQFHKGYEDVNPMLNISQNQETERRIGFQLPEKQSRKTETTAPKKQPKAAPPPTVSKQAETLVAQGKQVETVQREKVIVSAPAEDVSKWKKYAVTYYKRSINSASETAKRNNRNKYEEYKNLLETAGYKVEETGGTLKIKE